MLSISRIADAEYYLGLAAEDYYLQGGEPPGQWIGQGAAALGLGNRVGAEDLRSLLAGYSPQGQPLIQNAGAPSHQSGWDLTFSAPKSVSAVWAVGDEELRRQIQRAQQAAVTAAVGYLERQAGVTRRGKGGGQREPADLLVATFEHGTSRAQDPQLHTHCLVVNVGVRADGTTGTLVSRPFYVHKMTAGAVYRAELARALWELGFVIRSDGSLFEVEGVPPELLREFSKRREEIEQALQAHGVQSAKASEVATLATRSAKESRPRAELLAGWQDTAREHGFDPLAVEKLRARRWPDASKLKLASVLDQALTELSRQQSYFARHEALRKFAEAAAAQAFSLERMEALLDRTLADEGRFISLGVHDEEPQYTSRELFETEQRLLTAIATLAGRASLEVRPAIVEKILAQRSTLSAEQHAAITRVTTDGAAVQVINGLPGTGKTTLLAACREAWEQSGYRVVGCTLSAKAARELADGSGITSHTIAKLLHEWDKTLVDDAQHHLRQLGRAALDKPTWQAERLPIDGRTVLVVDEAGMVDTHQMERLAAQVAARGARMVLVGDTRQLPPIGPGGGFQAIASRVGQVELTDMRRQRNARDIEALQALAEGDARTALESFALREMLVVCDSKQQAIERLVADWAPVGLAAPQETAILTTTNREARALNALCQAERLKASGQNQLVAVEVGEERLLKGDRVLCLENNRLLGVLNGDLGTVVRVDPLQRTLSIFLDPRGAAATGQLVNIPLGDYDRLQLGYARTTHKEQGATVENCFVLLGGAMQDKEISFVQASRHRDRLRMYVDRWEAGEDLAALAMQMQSSREKTLAHDLLVEDVARGPSPRPGADSSTPGGEAFGPTSPAPARSVGRFTPQARQERQPETPEEQLSHPEPQELTPSDTTVAQQEQTSEPAPLSIERLERTEALVAMEATLPDRQLQAVLDLSSPAEREHDREAAREYVPPPSQDHPQR